MRRFSQRNSLVTLSDINITPLLDLAFVLLIIFVIISPSIRSTQEHSLELNLPKGGKADGQLEKRDVRVVEVTLQGKYRLDSREMSVSAIEKELVRAKGTNPKLVVYVRADQKTGYGVVAAILDICQENGIKCSLRMESKSQR